VLAPASLLTVLGLVGLVTSCKDDAQTVIEPVTAASVEVTSPKAPPDR
jgi:hypothetical protein